MNIPANTPTDALMALLIETAGIVIVVVIAGISDRIANLMLVFVVALWILYLVENADTVSAFSTKLANIEGSASKA